MGSAEKPEKERSFTALRVAEFMSLVYCCLRACDIIDWQWYLVMLPLLIVLGGYLLLILLGLIAKWIVKMRSDDPE